MYAFISFKITWMEGPLISLSQCDSVFVDFSVKVVITQSLRLAFFYVSVRSHDRPPHDQTHIHILGDHIMT